MKPCQNVVNVRVEEVKEGYLQTLQDLTCNSKPLIDVLTEVAEENREYASTIVDCIEEQLENVSGPLKLPILYLIDSIIKNENIKSQYLSPFCKNLPTLFAKVYEVTDDNVRVKLAKLRYFWNPILPQKTLEDLDTMVRVVNPSWMPAPAVPVPSVHINPKFISAAVSSCNTPMYMTSPGPQQRLPGNVNVDISGKPVAATKEELQKELHELEMKRQELEKLKQSRPTFETIKDKDAAKLVSFANQLFAQVEQAKTGSYNPLEVQRVRNSAKAIKDSFIKVLNDISNAPKHGTLLNYVKDVITKITETEKVLADLEKSNQAGRKEMADTNQVQGAPSTLPSTSTTRPISNSRTWTGSVSKNPYVYMKPNNTSPVQQTPKNPPPFRIAPVSSQLINAAAARRARDPRLRKIDDEPAVVAKSNRSNTVVNGKEKKESSLSSHIENKSDKKQNESPATTNSVQKALKKLESKTKTKPESTSPDLMPRKSVSALKRKVENGHKMESSCQKPEKLKKEETKGDVEEKVIDIVASKKRKSSPIKSKKVVHSSSSVIIDNLFEYHPKKKEIKEKKTKTFSDEERSRLVNQILESKEMLDKLSTMNPDLPEKLSRYKNKKRTGAVVDPCPFDINDDTVDCVILASPKKDDMVSTEPEKVTAALSEPSSNTDDIQEMPIEIEPLEEKPEDSSNDVSERAPSPPHDFDIRSLIPTSVATNVPFSLPVVNEVITTSTDNPFGIRETKDIDYRQLFFSLAPTMPSMASSQNTVMEVKSPEHPAPSIEQSVPTTDKSSSNWKYEDNTNEHSKRRRTSSSISSSSSSSSSEEYIKSPSYRKYRCSRRCDGDDPYDVPYSPSSDMGEEKALPNYNVKQMIPAACGSNDMKSDLVVMQTSQPRAPSLSPPLFPSFAIQFSDEFSQSNFAGTVQEVPPADLDQLKMIDRDPMKTIKINETPMEIRHYGSTAVVFCSWDDPRQISFQSIGGPRNIIIDDKFCIPCSLNTSDVEALVDGKKHRFRLGVPTRELFVDGIGYECFFGGVTPIQVRFDGRYHDVKLGGPLPLVDIGTKRLDLVAGRIDVIINDEHTFPVFLDAKPQKIVVDDIPFVIIFIDSLKRVLINDVPFRTDFGGLPQSFKFNNKMYYFRFTWLPRGIVPGALNIYQMLMTKLPSPPPLPLSLQYSPANAISDDFSVAPVLNQPNTTTESDEPNSIPPSVTSLLGSINIDELLQSLMASGVKQSGNNDNHRTVKPVDFRKPESLKQKQPGMISLLYSGSQCGSCGLRFPEEQTLKYSEHLDWHFRLNRKGKDGAKTIHSRKWYYSTPDWMKFQEMEDKSDIGQSWFESHPATEYTEEVIENVPCVAASEAKSLDRCELCEDRFEQFYNEETEEWQLKNAILVDEKLYHPICYQDYKDRSDQSDDVEEIVDLVEQPISLDDTAAPKDEKEAYTDSIPEEDTDSSSLAVKIKLEKTDTTKILEKLTLLCEGIPKTINGDDEIDDEESDVEEVQLIEEPIEEIIIPDDANDLEDENLETLNAEDIIAAQNEVVVEQTILELSDKIVDITQPTSIVSIDGNIELGDSYQQIVSGPPRIKINISKNHLEERRSASPKAPSESEKSELVDKIVDVIDEQPPPPGEEDVVCVAADLKPRIKERKLTEYPPIKKGNEVSGLCSIM